MEQILPDVQQAYHVPNMVKTVDNKSFREQKADIKKIIQLLESIDATLKEMNKNQK